jgi:site-specific recombinase XerD
MEDVTPHTLRHTFGRNLVDAGVPLDRVAQLLGRESVDTTRIYTTPSEQDLQYVGRVCYPPEVLDRVAQTAVLEPSMDSW